MKYVKQFSIILGISFLAELLEILIPLPIAASVYGLVIMLVGLITKLIPLEKVETAADFLVDPSILSGGRKIKVPQPYRRSEPKLPQMIRRTDK